MHPQIRQVGPGNCQICGMALEPIVAAAESGPNPELADMTRRFWIGLALALPVFVMAACGADVPRCAALGPYRTPMSLLPGDEVGRFVRRPRGRDLDHRIASFLRPCIRVEIGMTSVWRMVNGWRRLILVGLAALALAFVPFHPIPSFGSGEPAAGHHVSAVDMHHHGSKRAQHAGPATMAAAHIPCGMSACAVATLPSLASLGIRAAFHLDLLIPTESGQAQLAAVPEQPPPRA